MPTSPPARATKGADVLPKMAAAGGTVHLQWVLRAAALRYRDLVPLLREVERRGRP